MFDWLRQLAGSKKKKKLVIAENDIRAHMPFWISFIKIYALMKGIDLKATITHIGLGEVLFEIETKRYGKFLGIGTMLSDAIGDNNFWIHAYMINDVVRIHVTHIDARDQEKIEI